jgi:hypothetical protein
MGLPVLVSESWYYAGKNKIFFSLLRLLAKRLSLSALLRVVSSRRRAGPRDSEFRSTERIPRHFRQAKALLATTGMARRNSMRRQRLGGTPATAQGPLLKPVASPDLGRPASRRQCRAPAPGFADQVSPIAFQPGPALTSPPPVTVVPFTSQIAPTGRLGQIASVLSKSTTYQSIFCPPVNVQTPRSPTASSSPRKRKTLDKALLDARFRGRDKRWRRLIARLAS